jgi:hypothetical protein
VVEVVGKRERTVPVLMTKEITFRINKLISFRAGMGIPGENSYVFARSSYQSMGQIRGSDSMKKHAELSGIKYPDNMRSTKLRKQIATASQMLALKENEIELLANYMGHDMRVHKEYYQLPDTVLRVTKLSKLFLALDKGMLTAQQGKSLEDLDLDEIISGK